MLTPFSPQDQLRCFCARVERFAIQFPGLADCLIHPGSDRTVIIAASDTALPWLLEHTAELRFWAWVALGAERLTIFDQDRERYSSDTFPFFEAWPKTRLKLKGRSSRLRIYYGRHRRYARNARNR